MGTTEQTSSPHFISRLFFSINIVLYILMVVVEMNTGKPAAEAVFEGASTPVLIDFGSCVPILVAHGQWWRLVTPNFLHLGLVHLLFNSVCLYLIGPQVEETYGSQKFTVIYLVTGIFSMFISSLAGFGGGGASGSLSGLIGLLAAYGYRLGGPFGKALMRQMVFWAVINMLPLSMFGAHINWVAHAAGAIAGGALGFVISSDHPTTATAHRWWNIASIGCAVLIMVSFVIVGINFGVRQRWADLRTLDTAALNAEQVLQRSLSWSPQSGPPAAEVAAGLRVAGSGLERVPSISPRGDEIKAELIELVRRRATAFEQAAGDPSIPEKSADKDAAELKRLDEALGAFFEAGK